MAPHSSRLAWKIPWTEEPGGLQSMESLRVGTTERLHFHFQVPALDGEDLRRKWQPTSIFCWYNPMDRGVWRITVHGVSKSWTQLSN